MPISLLTIRTFFDSFQRTKINDANLRCAAVLVLLVQENASLHVLLTKRTHAVEHHKGQISFPGGTMDPEDATAVATALRETEEELGLPKRCVEVLGVLSDFATPSGFNITPVVGFVASLPQLIPHDIEVAEVFTVPLDFFLDPQNLQTNVREHNGVSREVFSYPYHGHDIWGATAAILNGFFSALAPFIEKSTFNN